MPFNRSQDALLHICDGDGNCIDSFVAELSGVEGLTQSLLHIFSLPGSSGLHTPGFRSSLLLIECTLLFNFMLLLIRLFTFDAALFLAW